MSHCLFDSVRTRLRDLVSKLPGILTPKNDLLLLPFRTCRLLLGYHHAAVLVAPGSLAWSEDLDVDYVEWEAMMGDRGSRPMEN